MRFGFFVLLLSTYCYSQPVSALHSHISMCKFDLFLGRYHQTEFCFWVSSPSKGTRNFSSQEWYGRSLPTLVMFMTTMQCGNDGFWLPKLWESFFFLKVRRWDFGKRESKWNGGAPPHPFWGRTGEFWNVSGCGADGCSSLPNGLLTPRETVKVPESFTDAAFP